MLPTLVKSRSWAIAGKASTSPRNILLTNVPRTVTSSDIQREINKAGARGVSEIQLDYAYFKPTGHAFLTLVSSEYLQPSLKALQNLTISGIPIYSEYYDSPLQKPGKAALSHKSRANAAWRGQLDGHGPTAGLPKKELQEILTIAGLPARTTVAEVADVLKNFSIKMTPEGRPEIVKVPLPPGTISLRARFLVTAASQAEAHRLVLKMHASYLKIHGEDIQLTAKIIA